VFQIRKPFCCNALRLELSNPDDIQKWSGGAGKVSFQWEKVSFPRSVASQSELFPAKSVLLTLKLRSKVILLRIQSEYYTPENCNQ
jgi:hypothetical protein